MTKKEKLILYIAVIFISMAFLDRLVYRPIKGAFTELQEKTLIEEKKVGANIRNLMQKDAIFKEYEKLSEDYQAKKNEFINLVGNRDIGELKKALLEKRDEIEDYYSRMSGYKESIANYQERIAEIKVAELNKEVEMLLKHIVELKERIKKTEDIKFQLNYISELESWLSKKFSPLIAYVEKNVMIAVRNEFSALFKEWFSMLVSESFNVRLDEDFTPVIEQQDYELDYSYLSGGERTAIALAYRLALNQVINSLMSRIKTRDLVILDEPTDGFSDQQLDKMREVLDELNVGQLIIVSHEQKIEGFVENVIKFKKENGISHKI